MPVDAHYKVEPWLEREVCIFVAEDLEAECVVRVAIARLLGGFGVQAADEPVKGAEHASFSAVECILESIL